MRPTTPVPPPTPPPPAEPAGLRRVAERVATDAAEHLRGLPRPWDARAGEQDLDGWVGTKSSPTDVVTASDRAVETLVRERLAVLRPGDAVFGEEQVYGEEPGGGTERLAGDVVWVVDPINGTVNFLYGLPWFAVSVAATRDGETLAGAVVEPSTGRLWSAALGHGATCDGRPLAASRATDVALSLVGTGFAYDTGRRTRQAAFAAALLPRVRDVRRSGSAALDLCAVGAGWLDGYVEHGCNWWDWAAAALVASEAGAVVRVPGPDGSGLDDGLGADATLAAAPGVAVALADLVRDCGAAAV
ncbi:MAG: inositol monophosphatase family protein [Pseudonocardiales bacterium]|nr:inositol monophosphatase family protein [Pseudonocardiales bacterium]